MELKDLATKQSFESMNLLEDIIGYFKKQKEDIFIFLVALTIPFAINIGNITIIGAFIYGIYWIFKHPSIRRTFFLIITVSALTGKDVAAGLKQIDKSLLIILLVVSLIPIQARGNNTRRILTIFSLTVFFATIILILIGVFRLMLGASIEVLFFHKFSEAFEQHAVYFALYISLSIFSLTHYYFKDLKERTVKFILGVFPVLLVGLFLTASKAVILIFLLLFTIQILYNFRNWKSRTILGLILIIFSITIFNSPVIKKRFLKGLEFNMNEFQPTNDLTKAHIFSLNEKENISDLELRYILAKIGVYHVIDDKKYIFGYGIGDVKDYLDYHYMSYNLAPNWYEGFNLHNQYLQILVSLGVFVLVLFMSYLIYSFYMAFKNRNQIHLFFLTLMVFVFVFECILSRNKGIVFFFFFNTLFLIQYNKYETCNIRD